ncbi:TPA: hypothetical protein VA995_001985, partial [Streptococcus agalactiae]|nr:hypothetical protein [Streptococcus agalactiae]
YIKHLKKEWFQGMFLGLVELSILVVIIFDLTILHYQIGFIVSFLKITCYAFLLLTVMTSIYLFPMAARYEMSLLDTVKKSFIMACLNLKWTGVLMFLLIMTWFIMVQSSLLFMLTVSAIFIFAYTAFAYFKIIILQKQFAYFSKQQGDYQ